MRIQCHSSDISSIIVTWLRINRRINGIVYSHPDPHPFSSHLAPIIHLCRTGETVLVDHSSVFVTHPSLWLKSTNLPFIPGCCCCVFGCGWRLVTRSCVSYASAQPHNYHHLPFFFDETFYDYYFVCWRRPTCWYVALFLFSCFCVLIGACVVVDLFVLFLFRIYRFWGNTTN